MLIELLFSNPELYFMVAIAILLGLTFHEYSHAQAAYLLGDPTAKLQGRLTINPISHIDPIGTPLIFIFGLGWGKPVPFNPFNLRNQRWGPALVALAGPVSNFLLAVFVGVLLRFLPLEDSLVVFFFSIFVWLNLVLGIFNLLPIPPLDGSHIFLALLPPSLENVKEMIWDFAPFLLVFVILFMFYIGISFLVRPLFTLITGMPFPF